LTGRRGTPTPRAQASNVDEFFPERGRLSAARAVCARCPVRTACLEYALAHGETFGIWGGLNERERRRERRRRHLRPNGRPPGN
jgi:hypothetical protein